MSTSRKVQELLMRVFILVLTFLCFVSIKGGTLKLPKQEENLDNNLQDDTIGNEMNESNNENEEDDDMTDEDDITKAEENPGMHYFQGDVLTTEDQMAKLNNMLDSDTDSQSTSQLHSRALIKNLRRTWKNGVVPYAIKKGVDDFRRSIVTGAIKHWQRKTCIKFIPRKKQKDYVSFQQGNGCSSFVGRIGGKQEITVGNKKHRCKLGNIIHEIGHAVGFFHEQSRPDRDDFVKIVKENIKEGYEVNFKKFSTRVIDSKDVGYDYGSIMHYPKKIFGKNPKKSTVLPKKRNVKIGQRIALSEKDVEQIGKLYGCSAKRETDDETSMNNVDNVDEDYDNEMNVISLSF